MANTGTPNIGEAIGLQNQQFNPLDHIISSMKEGDRLIEEDAARRRTAHAERQKRLEKNQEDLDTILITNKDIDPMFQPHIASETKEFRNYIDEQQNKNENYRWQGDTKALLKLQELQNHTRNAETTTKGFIDETNKLAKLHPDDVEQTDEQKMAMDAIHNHDLEGYMKASKSPDGFGNPSLYSLKDKPEDFLPSLVATMDKVKQNAPELKKTLPNGTEVLGKDVDPENIALAYKAYSDSNPKFKKFKQNAITTGQYASAEDFDKAWLAQAGVFVKPGFNLSAPSVAGKVAEQLAPFSPFKSAGTMTNGTRVADIHGKPIKTTLIVNITDESGNESPTTLADAPVGYITNIGTKENPNLIAHVTVPEYIDEKKTQKEIDDEKSKLRAEGKSTLTVSNTRRVKRNITKQVDINPDTKEGTNNYQALISIPGFKEKYIDPVLALDVKPSKTEQKSISIPEVNSQAEYDAIPKGGKYISNGKTLIKK